MIRASARGLVNAAGAVDTLLIMRTATLVSWLITASLGAFMLHTWLSRGGLRRERARQGGLPPQLIFGHATAAAGGLLIWVSFLASGIRPLAWAAVGLLMAAIGLGLCTVTLWTPYPARKPGLPRSLHPGGAAANPDQDDLVAVEVTDEMIARLLAEPARAAPPRPVRLDPAVLVPVAHGFLAIGTFVLAVTSAVM
jgi:hypothetical protein